MKSLSPISVTRPATSARSLKRKPRYRSPQTSYAQRKRKGRVIDLVRSGLKLEEVASIIGYTPKAIQEWGRWDKEFGKDLKDALEGLRLVTQAILGAELPASAEVIRDTIAGKQTKELPFKAAAANLRGFGIWSDKQEQEHTGEITIRVEYDRDKGVDSPPPPAALPSGKGKC